MSDNLNNVFISLVKQADNNLDYTFKNANNANIFQFNSRRCIVAV